MNLKVSVMEAVSLASEKCAEEIHEDIKVWITKLEFINYEINFIRNDLLSSTSFVPYTKALFEAHTDLEEKMRDLKLKTKGLIIKIKNHDNKIGGILESVGTGCDVLYRENHQIVKEQYEVFELYYRETKKALISYASKILKYKKK